MKTTALQVNTDEIKWRGSRRSTAILAVGRPGVPPGRPQAGRPRAPQPGWLCYALLLACACCTSIAHAQYTIDWHTMDGGGGTGGVGPWAIHATLGQPDVATGAAGSLVFVGGYWSLIDEPLPLLRIFKTGADIVLAWPNPSPGFGLQTSPELVAPSWTAVATEPVKVGTEFQVTWGPPTGRRFFRLHRP